MWDGASFRDRRWRMFTCEYMNCQVTDLELLEPPELSDLHREVVKIATSFSCQDSTNSLSMSRVDSAEESYSVSDMTGSSRGVSESVTLSGHFGLEKIVSVLCATLVIFNPSLKTFEDHYMKTLGLNQYSFLTIASLEIFFKFTRSLIQDIS